MMNLLVFLIFTLTLSAIAGSKLAETIPYPFYDVQENQGNKVMVVNNGVSALELRLQMIRRAQKNIEVEYFIYDMDLAGKIFSRELVAAAKRGVKVRILVDKSLAVFRLDPFYATELMKYGIEVKYYNNAPIYALSTVQFRNHRKLLSIDDTEAITGGRNIAEDYFDMSHEFNFNDRDIYLTGPLAKTMRESFDHFFEHKMSVEPKLPKKHENDPDRASKWDARAEKARLFLEESPEELLARSQLAEKGIPVLENLKMYDCPIATFSTDAPGASFKQRIQEKFLDKFRFLRQTLAEKTLETDKAFTLSSPYLIHNKRTRKIMGHLLENKVDINVYTNSLYSTDAVYVAANLYLYLKSWAKRGIKIFLHDGKFVNEGPALTPEAEKARWGTHDKSQVFEASTHSEIMIGTYNIDNRSNFYNTEMAVFCRGNDELSAEVKGSIFRRMNKGIKVLPDGSAVDSDGKAMSVYGASKNKVLFMKLITLPSWLLNFLL